MKNAKAKSILVIVGTLLIGMVIGGLVAGHLIRGRVHQFMDIRGGKGFQREVLAAADPSPDQELAIKPILESFSSRLDSMHRHHLEELQENMALLEMSLEDHLSVEQMERVKARLRRMEGKRHRHGRGGRHGHGPKKFHHHRHHGE